MKAGFFAHKPSGCQWYRTEHPINALKAHGVDTEIIAINQDFDDKTDVFQFYGAYPFSFQLPLEWMKKEGKRIIYDADDALDLIDITNHNYYGVKKDLGSVKQILDQADEITVSTPEMEKYMRRKSDKKITVIPNCFVPSEWTYPRPKREGIRIGFAGSATHIGDLIEVLPAIKNLQQKYDITFLIMGLSSHSDYKRWYQEYRYVSTEEGIKELELFDKLLTEIRFEFVPFVESSMYPSTLINMALDIGLAPLKDTPFNRCRSACKAMEYTLSGALCLASYLEPYKEDKNSYKVLDGQWEEQIEFFINNPLIRDSARNEHLKWTKENRDINTKIDLLKSVYCK